MISKKTKIKSQGEIFGIALLFVVIIIGIIVYSQIKNIKSSDETNLQQQGEYKILAESSLNALLKSSTGCEVERGRDSLKDLINYCLENEYSGIDPEIECDGVTEPACQYVKDYLNESLMIIFNSSKGVAIIPYEVNLDIPANNLSLMANQKFTNLGTFKHKDTILTEDNRRRLGYKRAPSGLISWATAQRAIEFELYLYYR